MGLLSFESNDYYDTTYYEFVFCKLLALWPLAWRPEMKQNIVLDCFIGGIWLFILIYYATDNILEADYWIAFREKTESSLMAWGIRIQNLSSIVLGIFLIGLTSFQSLFFQNNFHKLIDIIVYVDKILEKEFYADLQFPLASKFLFFLVTCVTSMLISFLFASWFIFEVVVKLPSLTLCLSFTLGNVIFVSTVITFVVFVMTLRRRFTFLNDLICLMYSEKAENVFIYSQQPTISTIFTDFKVIKDHRSAWTQLKNYLLCQSCFTHRRITSKTTNLELKHFVSRLVHLHSKLCDGILILNDLMALKLLLATYYIFTYVPFACFASYRMLYQPNQKASIITLAIASFLEFYLVLMIAITASSTVTCKAAKEMGRKLHKVAYKAWDPVFIKKLTIASHQLFTRNPEFTCHFFPFNRRLLFLIMSSNLTYLIFLIQLDISPKNNFTEVFNVTLNENSTKIHM